MNKLQRKLRRVWLSAAFLTALLAIAACGAGEPAAAPTATPLPRAAATLAAPATAAPAATARPAPTPTPTAEPTATPAPIPTATPDPWAIPGIPYPGNFGWPRVVEVANGTLVLEGPPQRIHTLSLGHDEIVVALGVAPRLVGVGSFTANATYSNVAEEVAALPRVRRDPEEVIALDPDLVLASKFTKQDLVDAIQGAGITVARTALEQSVEGHEQNIRLLGYMLGAEEAAETLIAEIRRRLDLIDEQIAEVPRPDRPLVLAVARYSESITAAGGGSTEGGIIERAGGRNAAAEAGLDGHKTVSAESIIALEPEVIVITQPEPSAGELRDDLLNNPVLANVPAIANGRVFVGEPRYLTTLSHWNVRGMEELAASLYPDRFEGIAFADFE